MYGQVCAECTSVCPHGQVLQPPVPTPGVSSCEVNKKVNLCLAFQFEAALTYTRNWKKKKKPPQITLSSVYIAYLKAFN